MRTIRCSLIVLAVVLLPYLASTAPAVDESSAAEALDPYIGRWLTEYEDHEGPNREVWTFSKNPKGMFLHVETETWVGGDLAFLGTGFVFYSAPDAEYRLLLMMDNGALHESIGSRDEAGKLSFNTRTYGVDFPEHATDLSLSEEGMLVAYRFSTGDGKERLVERRFRKDPG